MQIWYDTTTTSARLNPRSNMYCLTSIHLSSLSLHFLYIITYSLWLISIWRSLLDLIQLYNPFHIIIDEAHKLTPNKLVHLTNSIIVVTILHIWISKKTWSSSRFVDFSTCIVYLFRMFYLRMKSQRIRISSISIELPAIIYS